MDNELSAAPVAPAPVDAPVIDAPAADMTASASDVTAATPDQVVDLQDPNDQVGPLAATAQAGVDAAPGAPTDQSSLDIKDGDATQGQDASTPKENLDSIPQNDENDEIDPIEHTNSFATLTQVVPPVDAQVSDPSAISQASQFVGENAPATTPANTDGSKLVTPDPQYNLPANYNQNDSGLQQRLSNSFMKCIDLIEGDGDVTVAQFYLDPSVILGLPYPVVVTVEKSL